MIVVCAEVRLYAPWVHSLKEKRMTVKSIIAKTQNKFHVSIAEVAENDVHQTIVLGIACVAGDTLQANRILDRALRGIETSTEAEVTDIRREVR